MKRAITLAVKGQGKVNPNPLVGAVIVKDGKIIGEGYHKKYGEAHAEINALNSLNESSKGATIYVTLEPCSHFGKTPPCVSKIIDSEISRVVIGMKDPNPLVAGRGIKKLKEAGIEVTIGVLEEQCRKINEVFIKYITTKIPFVVLKTAMTIDGKIATKTGQSKWITSEESRKLVHSIRNSMAGIMVGVNTVIEDNPELTCRITNGRNPYRIIVDSKLRIPIDSKVVINNSDNKTIIATTNKGNKEKLKLLESKGIKMLLIGEKDGQVSLKELINKLGQVGVDGVLIEGGGSINFSALESGIVDKIMFFVAPKIIGGSEAKTPVEGEGVTTVNDAFKLSNLNVHTIGTDILIEGYIK